MLRPADPTCGWQGWQLQPKLYSRIDGADQIFMLFSNEANLATEEFYCLCAAYEICYRMPGAMPPPAEAGNTVSLYGARVGCAIFLGRRNQALGGATSGETSAAPQSHRRNVSTQAIAATGGLMRSAEAADAPPGNVPVPLSPFRGSIYACRCRKIALGYCHRDRRFPPPPTRPRAYCY